MGADKRIPVTESTWQILGEMKGAGETYDELIGELIDEYGDVVGGDAEDEPGDWREEIQTRDGDGDTCPECGHELVDSLGRDRPACPSCGWSP